MHRFSRRDFLQHSSATIAIGSFAPAASAGESLAQQMPKDNFAAKLVSEVGITTSSLSGHLGRKTAPGKFTLLELPKIMRNELDMNTSSLASNEPAYLDRVRAAVNKAGCVLINLKLNQRGLDMNSTDAVVREKAMRIYKQSITAASRLGIPWARPRPLKPQPDMQRHVAAYRELADYGERKNVRMLVENYDWMQSDPNSVTKLIKAIDRNVAASPDTGNWNSNQLRYAGLAKTFPLAVTCDFKARALGPQGQHKLYDLKRCFTIGWKAGFRGPWCLEHANPDRQKLFAELALLRDMLRRWTKDATSD